MALPAEAQFVVVPGALASGCPGVSTAFIRHGQYSLGRDFRPG